MGLQNGFSGNQEKNNRHGTQTISEMQINHLSFKTTAIINPSGTRYKLVNVSPASSRRSIKICGLVTYIGKDGCN